MDKELRYSDIASNENNMVLEGYAIVFDQRALLYEVQGVKYYEVIERSALKNTDLKDVCLKYNHGDNGKILARTRNNSLELKIDDKGLFIRANLADTTDGQDLYKLVKRGDLDKMSFAFNVDNEDFDKGTNTRHIRGIKKVFEVSVVDTPAYEGTSVIAKRCKDIFENEAKEIYRNNVIASIIELAPRYRNTIPLNELEIKELEEIEKECREDKKKNIANKEYLRKISKNNELRKYGDGNIFRNEDFKNNKEVRVDNIMGNIALRSKDKLIDRINVKEEEKNINIGKYVRGIVTGNWEGAEIEKRAMLTTSTGALIPEVLSAKIIDLSRNESLFTLADVPVIPMGNNNNITVSRVKTDPVFKFKEEGKESTESSMEIDSVQLKAKTVYGYAYISLESIKSSQNLDFIINNAFSKAIAEAIDKAMLYGQYNTTSSAYDTFAPSGIINDSNINSIAATSNSGYDDIIKAIGKVRKANGVPNVLGINSDTEEIFNLIKTTDGQYLEAPKSVQALTSIVSNQLLHDDTTGNDGIIFDNNAMVIGLQESINIRMMEETDECLKKGLVAFRIYAMLDCQVTQPKHICKVTGIK